MFIVAAVTFPLASTVMLSVNPVPEPDEVVATLLNVPSVYPVPAALIEPRVLTPVALALAIVIVSLAA